MKQLVKSKKMWLAFTLVFIAGIVIGVLSGVIVMHQSSRAGRPMPSRFKSIMLMHMTQRLNLTVEQKEQVKPIIGLMMEKIHQHQTEQRPVIKAVVDTALSDIEKILTEEQQIKFNKMKFEMAKRRRRKPPGFSGVSGRYGKHRHGNSDKSNKTNLSCAQDTKCQSPPTPPTPEQ
ncbi:MAG: hypothetical protein L3J71_16465 [Victivallaceae bacterium]|nr:hypothetical protein [Victivallaceae bacterium]